MSFRQVDSLPLAPTETGQMWYAVNRLGFNCLVCHCWGYGLNVPHNVLFLTRVMEKPGLLSATLLMDLLDRVWGQPLKDKYIQELVLWQDILN